MHCQLLSFFSTSLQELIKRLSLTVLILQCISSGEIGFGEFGSMEEVASLRPVSLIYLSYMPDSIFHFLDRPKAQKSALQARLPIAIKASQTNSICNDCYFISMKRNFC